MPKCFDGCVGQRKERSGQGDLSGLYKRLKGIDMNGKNTLDSQCIEHQEDDRLLGDDGLIQERRLRWLQKPQNTKARTLGPSIVDGLKVWPPWTHMDEPKYEEEEAARANADRKEVGPDRLLADLLEVLADEGDSGAIVNVLDTVVVSWRGTGCVALLEGRDDQGAAHQERWNGVC